MSALEAFKGAAGGVYRANADYNHQSQKAKNAAFWDFFKDNPKFLRNSRDIYSGEAPDGSTVAELQANRLSSIEHIIPKSHLKTILSKQWADPTIWMGSTMCSFNMAALHRNVNSVRNNFWYDLDGDPIVRGISDRYNYEYCGFDKDGEWVVPVRTHGDVARAMLYMIAMYELRIYNSKQIRTLLSWNRDDPPTAFELAYNQWVFKKHQIINPFLADYQKYASTTATEQIFADLYADESAEDELSDAKASDDGAGAGAGASRGARSARPPSSRADSKERKETKTTAGTGAGTGADRDRTSREAARIGNTVPGRRNGGVIRIAEVMANPGGVDVPGSEFVMLVNDGDKITLDDSWDLAITPSTGARKAKVFSLAGVVLPKRGSNSVTFTVSNALPNGGATIVLRQNGQQVAAATYPASSDDETYTVPLRSAL